jgi:sulfide:quinone oxidoreductase
MTTTLNTQKTASRSAATSDRHHQIVIVGGGASGITVASQLLSHQKKLDIAIIEPSDKHYYQPGWTLVGGGVFKLEQTARDEKDCLPDKTTWIQDFAETLDPDNNTVITRNGTRVKYDYLVLGPGIQIDWHLIKGLKESCNYSGLIFSEIKEESSQTAIVFKR